MGFREFFKNVEAEMKSSYVGEASVGDVLRRGLLGGALALSPLFAGSSEAVPSKASAPAEKVERDQELVDELKNSNRYWDGESMKRLVRAANAGDEWAVREIAWPKGHRFHKKGRPFLKNDGPHPKGLFPYSGN